MVVGDATDVGGKDEEALTVPKCSNLKDFVLALMPDKLRCCKCCTGKSSSRKNRALIKARVLLEQETNMIEIIKRMRYFDKAIAHIVDEEVRANLKAKSCFF